MKFLSFIAACTSILISCTESVKKDESIKKPAEIKSTKFFKKRTLLPDSIWSNHPTFLIDSLVHGHSELIRYYFSKYSADTCYPYAISKIDFKDEFYNINSIGATKFDKHKLNSGFTGIVELGKIKAGNKKDSVFVMTPLNWCDEVKGRAYYFTDTSLPRLETGCVCCYPDDIFLVGDIDEDGIAEIGEWNSSCTSKYKGLIVWSLKNKKWKEIGSCGILASDFNEMHKRIRKIGKGKFEMRQILDNTKHPKGEWLSFKM